MPHLCLEFLRHLSLVTHPVEQTQKSVGDPSFDLRAEDPYDFWIDLPPNLSVKAIDHTSESIEIANHPLEQEPGCFPLRWGHLNKFTQNQRHQGALFRITSRTASHVERRGRSKRNEVYLFSGSGLRCVQLTGIFSKQREPARQRNIRVTGYIETSKVLASEIEIRTDIDDVDSLNVIDGLEMGDGSCDNASRNDALAQPRLVRDQKSV